MSFLHRLFENLHRREEPAKVEQNLRAEDGFVRVSRSRGFLRIYE